MASRPPIAFGWVEHAGTLRKQALKHDQAMRHLWCTGKTGCGKSGFLLSIILPLLVRTDGPNIIVFDGKGELAGDLIERFLPALHDVGGPEPSEVGVIRPFASGGVGTPLDPCARIPGIAVEVQAKLVTDIVASIAENGSLGHRMAGILMWTSHVAITTGDTLHSILRMLREPLYRQAVLSRLSNFELRRYIAEGLDREPKQSVQALIGLLERLLMVPSVRAQLCAGRAVSGREMLEQRLTLIDPTGAPMGFTGLSAFVSGYLWQLITAAVFDRKVDEGSKGVLIVADEFQVGARVAPREMSRLFTQARWKKTALWVANQHVGQLRAIGGDLLESCEENSVLRVQFAAEDATEPDLAPLVTGWMSDPERPDQVLSRQAELSRVRERVAQLKTRQALLSNRATRESYIIEQTLSVPYDEAGRRAKQCPHTVKEAFKFGAWGIPMAELIAAQQGLRIRELEERETKERRRSRPTDFDFDELEVG